MGPEFMRQSPHRLQSHEPPPDPRRPLFAGALAEALARETRWAERFSGRPPKQHFQRVALDYELNVILDEQWKYWEQKGKNQGLSTAARLVRRVPTRLSTSAAVVGPDSQMLSSAPSRSARLLRQPCARWRS